MPCFQRDGCPFRSFCPCAATRPGNIRPFCRKSWQRGCFGRLPGLFFRQKTRNWPFPQRYRPTASYCPMRWMRVLSDHLLRAGAGLRLSWWADWIRIKTMQWYCVPLQDCIRGIRMCGWYCMAEGCLAAIPGPCWWNWQRNWESVIK